MGYLFLTGATGLLGTYLLRDLLSSGTKLAVLVRSTRFATAQQRIETALERWERQAGRSLPRPVVLEGSLSAPDLGMGEEGIQWAARNCEAFMHNAASLTFHADDPQGEPYRSNVGGTRNVLEFCQRAGIREFHHVSTAYVSGLREDIAFEHQLDVGQKHGNDYEVSKCQSEKMVRSADFLESTTVYRPGIIFGDSQTGYTSTFHGFYVPLKLVSSLIAKTAGMGISRDMMEAGIKAASQRLRQILELNGTERKNYVPVDWVSAAMTHIYTHREHHGLTYHLTPRQSVEVAMTQRVMEDAFLKYAELTPQGKASSTPIDWNEFEKFFVDGMTVYRSYWRNDPGFDYTNIDRALPHLPCPELNEELIMKMCRYAIESNFGWPVPPIVKPEFNVHEHISHMVSGVEIPESNSGRPVYLGLQVNGRGGGQWELAYQEGRVVGASQGVGERCTATFYLNTRTFESIAKDNSTVNAAIDTGRVLIEGNGVPLKELINTLERVVKGTAASSSSRQEAE